MPTLLESPFLSLGMIDTLLRTTSDPSQRVQLLSARVHRLQLEPAIASHSSSHSHTPQTHTVSHTSQPHSHGSHPYAHAAAAHGHLSGLAALAAHHSQTRPAPAPFEHAHERPAQLYGDGFGFELDIPRSRSRTSSRQGSRAGSRAASPVRSGQHSPKRPTRPDPTPLLKARTQLVGAYLSLSVPDLHAAEAEVGVVLGECRRIVKWERARIRAQEKREQAEKAAPGPAEEGDGEAKPTEKEADGENGVKKGGVEVKVQESKEDGGRSSDEENRPPRPPTPPHVSPPWYTEVLRIQLEATRYEAKINDGLGREGRAKRANQLAEELAAEIANL